MLKITFGNAFVVKFFLQKVTKIIYNFIYEEKYLKNNIGKW